MPNKEGRHADGRFMHGNKLYDIHKVGRHEYWTEERIGWIMESLEKWAEKDDSICLADFRANYGLVTSSLQVIRNKSPVFSLAYEAAQLKVAGRLAKNAGKTVHVVHYNKYQSYYDSEMKQYEKD